jgi:glycosyltransferase involved in cell wall biosynthesis
MKLSFVVPAYNEEKLLGVCLAAISSAFSANRQVDLNYEIIVVDNNSTDTTPEVARSAGATVVFEPINQISRARNTGARAATGDWLIFVDADCEPSAGLISDVLSLIAEGSYIGCGSLVAMHELPFWGRFTLNLWTRLSRALNWAAGSFIVCRTDAFREVDGFSEDLFAAEEIDFSIRIKRLSKRRQLRFTILSNNPLHTSNRKLALYSGKEIFRQFGRLIFRPRKTLRDKQQLNVWYDGRR